MYKSCEETKITEDSRAGEGALSEEFLSNLMNPVLAILPMVPPAHLVPWSLLLSQSLPSEKWVQVEWRAVEIALA